MHRPARLLLACALAAAPVALRAQSTGVGTGVSEAPPELQAAPETAEPPALRPLSEAPAPPELQAVPEAPVPPQPVRSGEALEPDVRIVRRDGATVTEYRVNGRLRAVKVQPDGDFPPYYLYDTDGDGSLESRRNRFDPDLMIPRWVIFSW